MMFATDQKLDREKRKSDKGTLRGFYNTEKLGNKKANEIQCW